MTDRSDDITTYMAETPRVLILNKAGVGVMTEIIQQDLADSVRYIEKKKAQMDDLPLIKTRGKQDLGSGVTVGITNTFLNTQWGFEARTASKSSGAVTTADSDGILLIDSGADFVTDGVSKGALILNLTDNGGVGTVLRVVDLHTLLLTAQMSDGTDNQFEIGDSYKIWNIVQCKVSGGNLVAVESDLETTMGAIFPTAFTQILLTSSSSATLQSQEQLEYSTFGGGIWIDVVNGVSGTTYPTGTLEQPSNNLTDAKAIAVARGFNKIFIAGNITIGVTENIDDYILCGQSPNKTTISLTNGCSTSNSEFEDATLIGTLDGKTMMKDCDIDNLAGVDADLKYCTLKSTMTMAGTNLIALHDCKSGVPGTNTPVIDMNGAGRDLSVRAYSGGLKIQNLSGDDNVSLDFVSGHAIIDSTIADGTIVVRGASKVTDNSTGVAEVQIADSNDLTFLRQYMNGKWEIVNNQMIFYDEVGGELIKFDLFNVEGAPTMTKYYKRVPI